MRRKLNHSVMVITGASSGVGRAVALRSADRGASLALVARREEALRELAEECERRGGRALTFPADVSDPQAMDDVARRTVEAYGRIDAWVNNAAVTMFARLEEAPLEEFRRVLDTNMMGYVYGARAALPWFREQGEGTLVNVGSVLSRVGSPYLAPYVMSKHAVAALSECIRSETLDVSGIKVCDVLPGAIDTPLFEHAANYTGREIKALRPTYSPDRVAKAIVSCVRRPRREVFVGVFPRLTALEHTLFPALTQRILARTVDRDHFDDGYAAPTRGNLHSPMPETDQVGGGWKTGATLRKVAVATAAAGAAVVAVRSRTGDGS